MEELDDPPTIEELILAAVAFISEELGGKEEGVTGAASPEVRQGWSAVAEAGKVQRGIEPVGDPWRPLVHQWWYVVKVQSDQRWTAMVNPSWRRAVNRLSVSLAGLMTGPDEEKMDSPRQQRILVVGKSGNGKSSVCNSLTGGLHFTTGRGLAATTRTLQYLDTHRHGHRLRVVDTPDVTNCDMTSPQMEDEVRKWRRFTDPYPTTVLLTVRCDVRYTAEEHAIYRQLQRLWGDNSLSERLVVAFTFGDRQDVPLEEELLTVCPELQAVLRDARHRYVVFNNKAPPQDRERQVQQLLALGPAQSLAGRRKYQTLSRGLLAVCVISGLCFAATLTANKGGAAVACGLLCLLAGVGVVGIRIKEKMN
ncbi:hypothetical protein ACOMHN_066604 [Nucella lapillus]